MENNLTKGCKINISLYDINNSKEEDNKMSLTPCSKIFYEGELVPNLFPKKKFDFYKKKWKSNKERKFLNNKRKEKNFHTSQFKPSMQETPHNTGQYLSHIHQEMGIKRKSSKNGEKEMKSDENENLNDNENDEHCFIGCYESDGDDFGFCDYNDDSDFEEHYNKKRDRLLSLEGKDLENFIFKSTPLPNTIPETEQENNISEKNLQMVSNLSAKKKNSDIF